VFQVTGRKEEKRLTLDEEYNVDAPYTDCRRHSDLISVPNRNAGDINKRLIWGDCSIAGMSMRTYARRAIKSEEADAVKKEKAWKKMMRMRTRYGGVPVLTISKERATLRP